MDAEDTTVTYKIIVKDADAVQIIEGLQKLKAIEVVERRPGEEPSGVDYLKYSGIATPESPEQIEENLHQMRSEWDRSI